jgi:hypothetical protein
VVLNSPGDMETGIFIQQADAAYKFTHRVWNQQNEIWFSHYWTFKEDTQVPMFISQDNMQEIWYSGLGSSPRNYFQMEYANLFTAVTPV